MPEDEAEPSPTFSDYVATRAEQGCLQIGISICGAVLALLIVVLGSLLGVHQLKIVAAVIFLAALAVGIFVGHDVNYKVSRMRERAAERAEDRRKP